LRNHPAVELSQVPQLKDRWVAIDPSPRTTPLHHLRNGGVVVDADDDLEVLCARLRAAKESSLTIVYAGRR